MSIYTFFHISLGCHKKTVGDGEKLLTHLISALNVLLGLDIFTRGAKKKLNFVDQCYRRISLRHNLSMMCRKIVTFVSIKHSKCNIWNGPIVATAIGNITQDMLERVWRDWEYGLDICRVTRGGAHRIHLTVTMNLETFLFQMVATSCISLQYL
jgi:hypothetical protein